MNFSKLELFTAGVYFGLGLLVSQLCVGFFVSLIGMIASLFGVSHA